MNTEYINRVEMQGIIGSFRTFEVGARKGFQFTLAVNDILKGQDGGAIIETMWCSCSGWESGKCDPSILEKGNRVHVNGRLKSHRYTNADGDERVVTEIIVHNMKRVD